jgi:galactoside O-acetyltransferase
MKLGYYSKSDLSKIGFSSFGDNVFISKKVSIYGAKYMKIGSNVRIDDFCLLVGKISIGNFVHIGAFTGLHASLGSITIKDFSTLSSKVAVYAASDDYSGSSMTNSVIPVKYKKIEYGDIQIGKHVIVGTGCTILHRAILQDGVAIGAMSLVNQFLPSWQIYGGIPCQKIKTRLTLPKELEISFLREYKLNNRKLK